MINSYYSENGDFCQWLEKEPSTAVRMKVGPFFLKKGRTWKKARHVHWSDSSAYKPRHL